jgi:hypothetical protein
VYNPNPEELEYDLGEDYEMGRLLSGKVRKKLKKAVFAPLTVAHKITHGKNSPIRKAELGLQKVVGKALPFTKPFIKAHNAIADKQYKAMEKAGVIKKGSTRLASKAQTTTHETALADASDAYAARSGKSAQSADPKLAAAQMAAGAVLRGKPQALVSPANAAQLVSSADFRGETLAHLLSQANGGNQAALSALQALRR